jgi:hypothetical protein
MQIVRAEIANELGCATAPSCAHVVVQVCNKVCSCIHQVVWHTLGIERPDACVQRAAGIAVCCLLQSKLVATKEHVQVPTSIPSSARACHM